MNLTTIETIDELKYYLAVALKLEHATLPPYLTAMYSIAPRRNLDAEKIIRVVAVEEMLHMTLVANMMNAIGEPPDLTGNDFVPEYPAFLPDGETDFRVNLAGFSRDAIENFLQIERPTPPASEEAIQSCLKRDRPPNALLKVSWEDPQLAFYSVGEFYAEIGRGFERLHEAYGPGLFKGDPDWQVRPEEYYAGGGRLIPVENIESVREGLRLIIEQGEGYGGGIYNREGELAHYYRFQQLKLGRYYTQGDEPDNPQGPPLDVDFSAVYTIKSNPRLIDYPPGSALRAAVIDLAGSYTRFLGLLTQVYTGQPNNLREAVAWMFALKEKAIAIVRNPIPGMEGVHATPIFALPSEEKVST